MKLVKRTPHLGWLINILAILLACFLMMNSLLGAIYVNQLKNKILILTDNYFVMQRKLLDIRELIAKNQSDIYKLILLCKEKNIGNYINIEKNNLLNNIRNEFFEINSTVKEVNKFSNEAFVYGIILKLVPLVSNYTIILQKSINENIIAYPANYNKTLLILNNQKENYNRIQFNLEILLRFINEKSLSIKTSDDILLRYLPMTFIFMFLLSLIMGGVFIYVSRREVKKSILENTISVLSEAREYQMDCIETLEICKEILEHSSQKTIDNYSNFNFHEKNEEYMKIIEEFKNFIVKIELAFETRRFLHEREKVRIDKEIAENKNKVKSIY